MNIYVPRSFPVKVEEMHYRVKEPQAVNLSAGRRIPSVVDTDLESVRKMKEAKQGTVPYEEKKMINFYKNFKACERIEKTIFDGDDHTTLKKNKRVLEDSKYCQRYMQLSSAHSSRKLGLEK